MGRSLWVGGFVSEFVDDSSVGRSVGSDVGELMLSSCIYVWVVALLFSNIHFLSAIVVLTLTHRHNTIQSVVAGQAPITLEWKKYLGKNKTSEE